LSVYGRESTINFIKTNNKLFMSPIDHYLDMQI